jgi:hypothetical protein
VDEYYRHLIDDARATYKEVLTREDSRITRGNVLWDQFQTLASACEKDLKAADGALREKINELAVAKIMAEDAGLKGAITYEPGILPSGRKIDFVADRLRDNVYVEVKSVHPNAQDTEDAWQLYLKRRKRHPENADFVTHKDWMGGQIYGNAFASRSRFLEYTLDFEQRLAEAKKIREGPGLLIFCNNGVRWHRSSLEDFADYYHSGQHRKDDPFALMEQHYIDAQKLKILHNVDNIGYLRRPSEQAAKTEWFYPLRGPHFGR